MVVQTVLPFAMGLGGWSSEAKLGTSRGGSRDGTCRNGLYNQYVYTLRMLGYKVHQKFIFVFSITELSIPYIEISFLRASHHDIRKSPN